MSKHWESRDVREQRIRRALVVDEFGSVSWDEYIRRQKRADNGRTLKDTELSEGPNA